MNRHFDLKKELDYVIRKYGAHEGYNDPKIEWSDNTYWGALGKYEYWNNKIIISRILNSPEADPEFLRFIIFHEYTHQLYAEHDEKFKKEMRRFPNNEKMEELLSTYGANLTELPLAKPSLPPLDTKKPVLFCRLPFREEDEESYYSGNLMYINHNVAGKLHGKIPGKYCNKRVEQVIWVIERGEQLFIVGAAKNVQLFPDVQRVHDGKLFGKGGKMGDDLFMQFHCKQNEFVYLFPLSIMFILDKHEIPERFYKENVFSDEDLPEKTYLEIVQCYQEYDLEVIRKGMDDCEMDTLTPVFKTNDVDELYELACRESNPYRKIWILNKCLTKKQNYRLYKDLASAFDDISIFDRAIENYEKALKYRNQASVRERIEVIKSVIPEYEKYGLWTA